MRKLLVKNGTVEEIESSPANNGTLARDQDTLLRLMSIDKLHIVILAGFGDAWTCHMHACQRTMGKRWQGGRR